MKAFQIQFVLPCEYPEDNVVKKIKKEVIHFEVPINLPDMENIGFRKLLELAKLEEKPDLSTIPKNKSDKKLKVPIS